MGLTLNNTGHRRVVVSVGEHMYIGVYMRTSLFVKIEILYLYVQINK